MSINNITILGDGGWGTSLAIMLSKKGYRITLWSAFKDYAQVLNKKRINTKFLPGIKIPKNIEITNNLENIKNSELIILTIPSIYLRSVLKRLKHINLKNKILVSAIKGIENKTLLRMSEVIAQELGNVKVAVLSGPTIAREVAQFLPTTAVIACNSTKTALVLQHVFMTPRFRVYRHSDIAGVELGGSLKNVIAIACGISDGLGFGTNTKAALLARGLAEICRLGKKLGASEKTFGGVSGLGDLVTTCISTYSRNRIVGEQLGKGKTTKTIMKKMEMVAEGVYTVKAAYALSKKYKVDMPITKEIYNVIYNNKLPVKAVNDLMTRSKKSEI